MPPDYERDISLNRKGRRGDKNVPPPSVLMKLQREEVAVADFELHPNRLAGQAGQVGTALPLDGPLEFVAEDQLAIFQAVAVQGSPRSSWISTRRLPAADVE